jgi:hypothetical protein
MRTLLRHTSVLAALGGLLAATGLAAAKPLPQKQSNAILRKTIHQLRLVEKELAGADHDYGGHRVDAIRDVKAAIKQLRLALGEQPGKQKPKTGKPGAGAKEPPPQGQSNAVLREGISQLRVCRAELNAADHDYHGHRADAVKAIDAAIKQLEIALKYEKKREQK